MAPTAMLATELPAGLPCSPGSWTWRRPAKGLALVQIAAAIGTILQLLITLGQSEAPPVIVQAPERPDITVVVSDDHPGAGATGAGSLDPRSD